MNSNSNELLVLIHQKMMVLNLVWSNQIKKKFKNTIMNQMKDIRKNRIKETNKTEKTALSKMRMRTKIIIKCKLNNSMMMIIEEKT